MASESIQANRPIKLLTPSLGKDILVITGFTGHEGISELFSFQVSALAENTQTVAFDKLIGQPVAIELALPKKKKRLIHGIVNKVTEGMRDERYTKYQLEIVPHVWVLTKRYQSRIFQHITVVDMLKKVLAGFDVVYAQISMTGLHPRRYTAQYRETDFAFASRLMEEEGIYYFFKHTDKGEQMVLANTPQSHPDLPEQAKITWGTTKAGALDDYRIHDWEKSQELRSGKYSLWDHCFEMPQKTLEAEKPILETVSVGKVVHKLKIANNDKLEIYDYPGAFSNRFDGIDKGGAAKPADLKNLFEDNVRTVSIRMQEEAAQSIRITGASNCGNFESGHKLTLDKHFNGDGQYVLVSVDHHASVSANYVSGADGGLEYGNYFTCIPLVLPFRPARVTPKPCVAGTQTAMVVGPKGEIIFCDKYGRVKVQMNWDREGNEDPNSSCWMRVAQNRGGGKYGGMTIPHVGQEVIIAFEEGDVDRPIVTGCVFNADNMPPLSLPGHKTKTTMRDHGGNQIIMEGGGAGQSMMFHSPTSATTFTMGAPPFSIAPVGSGSGGGELGPAMPVDPTRHPLAPIIHEDGSFTLPGRADRLFPGDATMGGSGLGMGSGGGSGGGTGSGGGAGSGGGSGGGTGSGGGSGGGAGGGAGAGSGAGSAGGTPNPAPVIDPNTGNFTLPAGAPAFPAVGPPQASGAVTLPPAAQAPPGVNLQTAQSTTTLVGNNSHTAVQANHTTHVQGQKQTVVVGTRHDVTIADKLKHTFGNVKTWVGGFVYDQIVGDEKNLTLGSKSTTIVGSKMEKVALFSTSLIVGFKTEVIVGMVTSLLGGKKVEIIKGNTYKLQRGAAKEWKNTAMDEKSPKQQNMFGIYRQLVKGVSNEEVKGAKLAKVAADLRTQAKKVFFKAKGDFFTDCEKLLDKADKVGIDACDYTLKATNLKAKCKDVNFADGTLTIK